MFLKWLKLLTKFQQAKQQIAWKKVKSHISPSGNWTLVSRVTGGDTNHYTNEDLLFQLCSWVSIYSSYSLISPFPSIFQGYIFWNVNGIIHVWGCSFYFGTFSILQHVYLSLLNFLYKKLQRLDKVYRSLL